jgi:ABC-type antimicrobial peptide transport system permease subunit
MILAAAFAAAALLLAGVGLYGVVAYSVAQRRREFGVRLALGAQPGQVRALVVRQGVRVAVAGLAFGIPAAILVARLIRTQLFGVTPHDPLSYTAAIVILFTAAVAASWFAARRAASANALEALKAE